MSLNYSYAASAGASGVGTTAGNSGQLMAISSGSTINGQARDQAFTYDDVGRLVTASGWAAWGRRFSYDRWGNRVGMWDAVTGGNQLQDVQIGLVGGVASNRVTSVNSSLYTHDASGNLTNDSAHTYAYDGESRLTSVDNGANAANTYDSNNWRVKKVSGGVTTHYVWEGSQVIAEYNGTTGVLISEYIYAGSRMVARDQSSVLRYYHQDRLSTRVLTDGTGTVIGTEDHFPFGEDTGTSTGESEKHRFTTYERDAESNTNYAISRQHQPANGRFIQPDPIAGSAADPQSLNRYAYSLNDPVNLADPMGLDALGWINDASIHGPGFYLDGVELFPGQERFLWGLLSSGAGVIAPFGSKAYFGYGGATYIDIPGKITYRGDAIVLGVTTVRVEDSVSINFLLNDGVLFSPTKWNTTIRETLTAFVRNSECVNAYYLVGIDLKGLLSKGIAIGPADALQKLSARELGLTAAAQTAMGKAFFEERGLFSATPQAISTVGGAGTTNGIPKIFLGTDAFTDLKEVLAHELIHSGGFQKKSSGANDLAYMEIGYHNIINTCAK